MMQRLSMVCVIVLVCSGLVFGQHGKDAGKSKGGGQNAEKNKETARRVFDDLWTGGRADLVDTLYESNAVIHIGGRSAQLSEVVSEGKEFREAFPDLVAHADRITGSGEMVEVSWSAHGTNRGKAKGFPGTGKPAKTRGTSRFKFDDSGKIAEAWVEWNENDVRRQTGGK